MRFLHRRTQSKTVYAEHETGYYKVRGKNGKWQISDDPTTITRPEELVSLALSDIQAGVHRDDITGMRCTTCGMDKPFADFSNHTNICKACWSDINRTNYHKRK